MFRRLTTCPWWFGKKWYSSHDKLGILMSDASKLSAWSSISASLTLSSKSSVEIVKGKITVLHSASAWKYKIVIKERRSNTSNTWRSTSNTPCLRSSTFLYSSSMNFAFAQKTSKPGSVGLPLNFSNLGQSLHLVLKVLLMQQVELLDGQGPYHLAWW